MTDNNKTNTPGGFQPDVEPTNAPIPQPVMPGQPVPPAVPVEPVAPTASAEPVVPAVPVEPVSPVAPVAPAEPVVPVAPAAEPAAPAPAIAPTMPAEPAAPASAVAPTMPAEPVPAPAQAPVSPAPAAPPAPQDSAPVTPAVPAEPAMPTQAAPESPAPAPAPAMPGQPIQPPAGYVAPTGAPVPPGQPAAPAPSPNAPSVDPNATPQGSFGHVGSFENPNVNNVPNGGSGTGALVFGILAVIFALLMPILGVIFGIVAIVMAGRAVRRTGKNGKTTGGRVCGIIGIVLSIIIFVASFALMSSVLDELESDTSSSSSTTVVGETADEKAVIAVVEAELDKLVNKDDSAVQMVADINDKAFEEDAEMTMAEAGMDSQAFAKWALEDLSYTIDSVYVYDDGAATVYVDVEVRDAYTMVNSFATDLEGFIDSADAGSMTMAEAKNKIGGMFDDAMTSFSGGSEEWYCSFDLVEKNGTWVIDSEDWDYEMEFLFEVF